VAREIKQLFSFKVVNDADLIAIIQRALEASAPSTLVELLERTMRATAHVARHEGLRRDIHTALAAHKARHAMPANDNQTTADLKAS
jgi:hypothetical protein